MRLHRKFAVCREWHAYGGSDRPTRYSSVIDTTDTERGRQRGVVEKSEVGSRPAGRWSMATRGLYPLRESTMEHNQVDPDNQRVQTMWHAPSMVEKGQSVGSHRCGLLCDDGDIEIWTRQVGRCRRIGHIESSERLPRRHELHLESSENYN